MSTSKHFDRICVAVLLVTLLLTVLFMLGDRLGLQPMVDEDDDAFAATEWFTANDLRDWDSAATTITLDGTRAHVSGKNAYVYGGDVIISNGGYFRVTGSFTGSSIIVDAHGYSKVFLLFDGVEMYRADDACFQVRQAEKVFLSLAEGTENRLESGGEFSEEAVSAGRDGTVFAGDDLTIKGPGALTVVAACKHGIEANDDLRFTGGTVSITAPRDAINVNDSLRICNTSLSLDAGDDGISVKNPENGSFYLESGSITVTAGDDAIHTAGGIRIAGGSLDLTAGDDAVHSDTNILLQDGTVLVRDCYEGLEAVQIAMEGGSVTVHPRDDGLNANGDPLTEETWIRISGGTLTIVAEQGDDADGLDSNGDLSISGGEIFISMPGFGSNDAIDFGTGAEISGGTVFAGGSDHLEEAFSGASAQCAALIYLDSPAQAGETAALLADGDEALLSWQLPLEAASILVSCPAMRQGAQYTLAVGEARQTFTQTEVSTVAGEPSMHGTVYAQVRPPLDGVPPQPGRGASGEAPEAEAEETGIESPEETAEAAPFLEAYAGETYLLLGVSALVLLLALAAALAYRKR